MYVQHFATEHLVENSRSINYIADGLPNKYTIALLAFAALAFN